MSLSVIEKQYHPIREWFLENGHESLVHDLKLCFLSEPRVNNFGWTYLEHDHSRLVVNITDHTEQGSPSDNDMVFWFYDRYTGQFLRESTLIDGERQPLSFKVIG